MVGLAAAARRRAEAGVGRARGQVARDPIGARCEQPLSVRKGRSLRGARNPRERGAGLLRQWRSLRGARSRRGSTARRDLHGKSRSTPPHRALPCVAASPSWQAHPCTRRLPPGLAPVAPPSASPPRQVSLSFSAARARTHPSPRCHHSAPGGGGAEPLERSPQKPRRRRRTLSALHRSADRRSCRAASARRRRAPRARCPAWHGLPAAASGRRSASGRASASPATAGPKGARSPPTSTSSRRGPP